MVTHVRKVGSNVVHFIRGTDTTIEITSNDLTLLLKYSLITTDWNSGNTPKMGGPNGQARNKI